MIISCTLSQRSFYPLVPTHTVVLNLDHHSHNSDHLVPDFTKQSSHHVSSYTVLITSWHPSHDSIYIWTPFKQWLLQLLFFLTEKFLLLAIFHTIIFSHSSNYIWLTLALYCLHLIFFYRIVISSGHLSHSTLSGIPLHGSHNLWSSLAE